jgi:oxygen-independent coproporphyrinogen III oxidase
LSKIVRELGAAGFSLAPDYEMTLEINPGTIDQKSLERWLEIGVNRFSVGAQTFDDVLLKKIGRKHSAAQTRETLGLLHGAGLNFTLDLLFALPGQSHLQLLKDIEDALAFDPPHVSVYCLTLPDQHHLNVGRPVDGEQVKMFEAIETRLAGGGLTRYEVSNYAKPGRESRHNTLYWSDQEYWGLGMSAHSYLKTTRWGTRFWNPPGLNAYQNLIFGTKGTPKTPHADLPLANVEELTLNQALTDFCHTHLRTLTRGLSSEILERKFPRAAVDEVLLRLEHLEKRGLVERRVEAWSLSREGRLIADRVFEELTFLKNENFPEKTMSSSATTLG